MTTTTLPAPRRISTIRYVVAALAVRLGLEPMRPEWPGATTEWADLLRSGVPASVLDGQPAPAIAAVPHREVHDPHLGVLRIAGREPARLFDALAGAFPVVAVAR